MEKFICSECLSSNLDELGLKEDKIGYCKEYKCKDCDYVFRIYDEDEQ